MITTSSPPLSLPNQGPEFSQAHDPNLHQRIEDQSPQTLTLDSSSNLLHPDPEQDFTIVDHEGEEELDESAMSKSGISSSLAPPQLIIPLNSDQESDPRSLTSPTSVSRRFPKRKIGAKKQKAIEKNVQTLIENLKPIPFKPTKNLNFGKHEKLLKRLGLWDFVHIEFDRDVRVDLIAQLIANFESRASYVNGFRLAVNRADLGRAFKLPVKKEKGGGGSSSSDAVYVDPEAVVTEESVEFIGEFVSNWLLLHEDTWILPTEVVNWTMAIKDGHPERVPWAGLLWFMVEKELSQGNKLKECYYASHLQHLIRSQKEELFGEENREEVGAELKEEDDGGDVEMWQEAKVEVNVEVKEEDDRVEVKMEQESEVETMVEAKKEEVDGEIKMAEEPLVEPGEEVKEEEGDGGKIGKEPTVEEAVDFEEEEDGGKVTTTEKFPMVDVGVDVKDGEGGCDMKMGKEPVMEAGLDVTEEVNLGEEPVVGAGVDVKEEVNLGEEPVVEAGVDVKEEVDFGEEPMVEAGGEVKGEESAGGEMKMGGFDDFLGQRSEGNVMGEEPNVELTLGKERAEEEQYEDVKEGHTMDVEDSDADEQGQWLLDGKNNMGDQFLQRCKMDTNRRVDGEEEGKPEEEEGKPEEEEEEELDEEEEEEAEDGEFDLMSQGNTLEGNIYTGNLLQGLQTTQMPFSLTETHGPSSSGPSMYVHNHSSKREIVHEDDMSHKRFRTDGHWNHKSPDFEMCMEEMQQWMGKARMVYQAKEHAFVESNMSQQVLLLELQRRDDLIEHLQKTKREEIQKKDGEIYRLERELYLMGSLLDGYRKAVKETQKAFSEYRQQCQLPEEPVYKDAGPGGLVLSTMELEKRRQKREEEEKMVRMVIEQKVQEFDENVCCKLEAILEAHFDYLLRLNERLMAFENEFKLLKELSMKPKVLITSESAPVEITVAPESAPVETTVAPESAPVETTVAPESAPVETSVAPESAPVETTVAPESAPVETTQTSDVVDM